MNVAIERFENLMQVQRPALLHSTIVVPGRIIEQPDISVSKIEDKLVNTLSELKVQDRQRTLMPLVDIVGDEVVALIVDACKKSTELEITAEVILIGERYALRFISATPIESAMQLIGASKQEIVEVEALAESCPDGLLEYIFRLLVELLGIKRIESIPILKKSLLSVILQSVSVGKINGTPGRIHILLVGPPAVGKGLIDKGAALLGPVHERISSSSVSPAGLIGTTENAGQGRTRVIPGKLVLASGGTAIMEDAQNVDTYNFRHTFSILSEMMEMGRLIRTTFGQIDLDVNTSLLLDTNPKSTVRPASINKEILPLDDIGLPVNFLSRVDLVFLFDRDPKRQQQLVLEMLASISQVGPEEELADTPKVRQLRVLIAYLRDFCPAVKLDEVKQSIMDRVVQLFDQNKEKLGTLDLASDFIPRGAKSILKLVAAAARLRRDCTATEADVEMAFDIFEEKMRFLNMIEPAFEHVTDWKCSTKDKANRCQRIMEHFAGQAVNINVVCSMFTQVKPKTVTRDLHHIGATHLGNGVWSIPSTSKIPA